MEQRVRKLRTTNLHILGTTNFEQRIVTLHQLHPNIWGGFNWKKMANFHGASVAALVIVAVALSLSGRASAQGLVVGYYDSTCPTAESIVTNSMRSSISSDSTVAPGVLRLAFHDCFVRGCDASVLLDRTGSEKAAAINVNLHGFEAIDAAKAAVEEICPGVVSCADILQFAARDAVTLTGGENWDVFGGRRDGTVSNAGEPALELPIQTMSVAELLAVFAAKNLNAAHMVALSGSHTLGIAHCQFVTDRLYNFPNSASGSDPSLPADLLASLKTQCPSAAATPELNMDEVSPSSFDAQYFSNIVKSRGLLASDQRLLDDSTTEAEVLANNGAAFGANFARAMVVMARFDVLTGSAGEIRINCRQTL